MTSIRYLELLRLHLPHGAVDLDCEPRTTPQVAAGEYGSWPISGHATDGLIRVRITGDFRLVAAQLAPMRYGNEDYFIERTWGVSEDFHPDDDLSV